MLEIVIPEPYRLHSDNHDCGDYIDPKVINFFLFLDLRVLKGSKIDLSVERFKVFVHSDPQILLLKILIYFVTGYLTKFNFKLS